MLKIVVSVLIIMLITSCTNKDSITDNDANLNEQNSAQKQMSAAYEGINQDPVPMIVERVGDNELNIEMTAQITDIEIGKDDIYKAWTFNGEAPGPLIVAEEGDKINFTLKNLDPNMPHSMDFHAVKTSPSENFTNVLPNETGTFTYTATNPGVFMYHCATAPVLMHLANGMHGTIIVKPKDGYPTDAEVDREFVIVQNEWYKYNDFDDFVNGVPKYVVFSTKALKDGDLNTNGVYGGLQKQPLQAKVGDRIRLYVNNVGPNEVSSFHVIGSIFDDVYIDGNPFNRMKGMQTVLLPASGAAVVEFVVTEEGEYPFVTHQFNHASKGATGIIKVSQ